MLNGPSDWSIPVSIDQHAEGILNLDIPYNDTCYIRVNIDAPCRSGMILAYLISAGDSIEMHNGKIRAADQRTGHQKEADKLLEVLSDAQLEYEYDIKLLLEHYPDDMIKWVDSLVGPLKATDKEGIYTARTTKRKIIELHRRTMPYKVLSKEYPDILERLYNSTGFFPLQDSDSSSEKPSKGGGPTKLPESELKIYNDGVISISYVDELTPNYGIPTGQPTRFLINLYNNSNRRIKGITNGFRVYSPDGANWRKRCSAVSANVHGYFQQ